MKAQTTTIPEGFWVRIEVGSAVVLGYTYRDPVAGLCARGAEWPHAAGVEAVALKPDRTVRLRDGAFPVAVLSESEVASLGLPVRPQWAADEATSPAPPWRADPSLRGHFHEDHPDDVNARFFWYPQRQVELMWVHLVALARDVPSRLTAYRGVLLNTSDILPAFAAGREVRVVGAPRLGPVHVDPLAEENAARWSIDCPACGFDLYPAPLDAVCAQLFPRSDVEIQAFTLNCVACGGKAIVRRRT